MKEKSMLRLFIIRLTGLLFTAYSAFCIFATIEDIRKASTLETAANLFVSLLYLLLAFFAFTSEVKNHRFVRVRRVIFIITMLMMCLLKLSMAVSVISTLEFSGGNAIAFALYGATYFLTLMAFLILLVYYTFIRKNIPLHSMASVALPLIAMIFFLLSFVAEAVLFFVFHFGIEETVFRTLVSRPMYYLSFIGLSAYFLYPPRIEKNMGFVPPDDSEFVKPVVSPYGSLKDSERVMPDTSGFVEFDDTERIPHKGSKHIMIDGSDFVKPEDGEYVPPEGAKRAVPDAGEFIKFDDAKRTPHKGRKRIMVDDSDLVMPGNGNYVRPKDTKYEKTEGVDFVKPDDGSYK